MSSVMNALKQNNKILKSQEKFALALMNSMP